MTIEQYTYLLEHPDQISKSQTKDLRAIIDTFPFFQSAHALYLKGLKNQESFAYNKALKRTACHTTNRSVLFEYITSDYFMQSDVSEAIKDQDKKLRAIVVNDLQDVTQQVDVEEQEKASQILDPDLFVEKSDSTMTPKTAKEVLQVGKPLSFTKNEAHSFTEWLQLSSFKPINRENEDQKNEQISTIQKSSDDISDIGNIKTSDTTDENAELLENQASSLSRERKQQIIDSFIETNPKISAIKPIQDSKKATNTEFTFSSGALMTETLARVYVEQKNYEKAKQAYRILSLKYPEKSGFFADQIRAVEQLEE